MGHEFRQVVEWKASLEMGEVDCMNSGFKLFESLFGAAGLS